MSKIKLVAFDLDGTTVPMGGTIPSDRFCNCVSRGLAAGVVFVPFTGRSMTTIPPQILDIPGIRYLSFSNGGGVFDTVTQSYLYQELMPVETCVETLHYLAPYDLAVQVFTNGMIMLERHVYENPERYPLMPHHRQSVLDGTAILVDDMVEYILENRPNIDKINIVKVLGKTREQIIADLGKNPNVTVVSSGGVNLEVNSLNTNKGNALHFLANHLGIDLKHVMALGDNDNDTAMLKTAGLGVVVANASDAAKATADFVTEAQDKDGAAIAIERFVLDDCTATL